MTTVSNSSAGYNGNGKDEVGFVLAAAATSEYLRWGSSMMRSLVDDGLDPKMANAMCLNWYRTNSVACWRGIFPIPWQADCRESLTLVALSASSSPCCVPAVDDSGDSNKDRFHSIDSGSD